MEPTIENTKPIPILVSRFTEIRNKPNLEPTIEDFSDIFSNEDNRKHSFEEVKKAFEFIFNKEKFIHSLNKEPNKESFAYLKQVRRYRVILRDHCRFFSSKHKSAEALNKFLYFLGQCNDRYWVVQSEEIKQETIIHIDNIEFPIEFDDTDGFIRHIVNELSEIQEIFKEKKLPVATFHLLRKKIRLFGNLVQIPALENLRKSQHWLCSSLFEISKEMGDQHDDLVAKGLSGEIDYDQAVLEVSSRILSEFERLKPFIEKICGLDK